MCISFTGINTIWRSVCLGWNYGQIGCGDNKKVLMQNKSEEFK